MTLSAQNVSTLRSFARSQAQQLYAAFAFEADRLRTLTARQPKGRTTAQIVQLHAVAHRTQIAERRWARVGGAR